MPSDTGESGRKQPKQEDSFKEWLNVHSFDILVVLMFTVFTLTSAVKGVELSEFLANLAGDTFGAGIVIFGTKHLKSKGSKESK